MTSCVVGNANSMSYHPTPSLSHLSAADYASVYEPAEDSFLLMDALERDAAFLKGRSPALCVEVGSGSGAVVTFLASLLTSPAFFWAVDINTHACRCSLKTLTHNGVSYCDVLNMDLMSCFQERLAGSVDIILFNPPYVETPSEEVGSTGIEASWAGGKDGREVIDRFLPSVGSLLSPLGVLYLLVLAQNKPDEISQILRDQGLVSECIISRTAHNERLSVLKFYHSTSK